MIKLHGNYLQALRFKGDQDYKGKKPEPKFQKVQFLAAVKSRAIFFK